MFVFNHNRSHSEFDEYIFSEEEEDEESNQENEDLEEEDETINEKPIKKEVVSFKKKKDSLKNKLVNKVNWLFQNGFQF